MTGGSSLAPIVVPIVALVSLAAWLTIVFYADRHPSGGTAPRPPPGAPSPARSAGSRRVPCTCTCRTVPGQGSAPDRLPRLTGYVV